MSPHKSLPLTLLPELFPAWLPDVTRCSNTGLLVLYASRGIPVGKVALCCAPVIGTLHVPLAVRGVTFCSALALREWHRLLQRSSPRSRTDSRHIAWSCQTVAHCPHLLNCFQSLSLREHMLCSTYCRISVPSTTTPKHPAIIPLPWR